MNNKNDPYVPVDCGLHSEYELAIMHKVILQLTWIDQHEHQHNGSFMPVDLRTTQHQEYLVVKTDDGKLHEIRLDKILHSDVNEVIKA